MGEINDRLKINQNCWFETQEFDNGAVYVWLSYIERYSAETDIEIEKEDAEKIVSFLKDKFGI